MKRLFCTLFIIICSIGVTPPMDAIAAETVMNVDNRVLPGGECSVLAVDVIVTKFRYHNGHQQYRRWNKTKNVWVDPYWINL